MWSVLQQYLPALMFMPLSHVYYSLSYSSTTRLPLSRSLKLDLIFIFFFLFYVNFLFHFLIYFLFLELGLGLVTKDHAVT